MCNFCEGENAAAVKYTEPHKRVICGAAQLSSAMSIDMPPRAQLSRAMSIDMAPGRSLVGPSPLTWHRGAGNPAYSYLASTDDNSSHIVVTPPRQHTERPAAVMLRGVRCV